MTLQGNVSNTWLQLTWSDPPSNRYPLEVDEFHIYYDHLSTPLADREKFFLPDNFTNSTVVNGTEREFVLMELESGNVYVVGVAYYSGRFLSDLSNTLLLETRESKWLPTVRTTGIFRGGNFCTLNAREHLIFEQGSNFKLYDTCLNSFHGSGKILEKCKSFSFSK